MDPTPLPPFPWRAGPVSARLAGRVALVTGAGGAAIGGAVAARLAAEGAAIVAVDSHGPRVEAAAAQRAVAERRSCGGGASGSASMRSA